MKTLSYRMGGILACIGALLPLFIPDVAPYIYMGGVLLFACAQISDRYEGSNFIIRRLRRQQIMGACFLIISGCLMFCSVYQIQPFRGGEWKIALAIAAFLEIFTIFRIDYELKKEKRER